MFYREDNDSLLEVVGAATLPGGGKATVLRGTDGSLKIVPSDQLETARYQALTLERADSTNEAIKETLSNIHQNSNLRFAAIPVFFTAFAVLAKLEFDPDTVPAVHSTIQSLGLAVAVWFGLVEIFLSRNLILWWSGIGKLAEQAAHSEWAIVLKHRQSGGILRFLRFALCLPYALATGFWASKLLGGLHASPGFSWLWNMVAVGLLVLLTAGAVWRRAEKAGK